MFKTQIKFQRILCLVALVAAALTFVYALGVITDIYEGLFFTMPYPKDPHLTYVEGSWIYYDMQPFNKMLVAVGIGLILCAILLFVTNTNSRRKYYVGNLVATVIFSVASLAATVWAYINIIKFRAQFLAIDFEAWLKYSEEWDRPYTESTFWFDAGLVVFGLTVLVSALLIFNFIWKKKLMKEEQNLIQLGKEA